MTKRINELMEVTPKERLSSLMGIPTPELIAVLNEFMETRRIGELAARLDVLTILATRTFSA